MAKRKNSTALFEVMRAAQQKALERQGISLQGGPTSSATSGTGSNGSSVVAAPAVSNPSVNSPTSPPSAAPTSRSYAPPSGQSQLKPLGTPAIVTVTKKWFAALMEKKPKSTSELEETAAPALDPTDPTAGMTAQSLASRNARPVAAPSRPAVEPNPEQVFVDESDEADLPPAATRSATSRPVMYTTVVPSYGRSDAEPSSTKAGNQVAIDRDRQEVTVKVRFQTVAIGVVATLAVVGLAYIAGKKTGTPTARTPTTPEIKSGPVQAGVLDPRGAKPGSSGADARMAAERMSGNASASLSPSANGSTTVRATDAVFVDSPVVNGLSKRDSGLNYCVIESFSPSQQQWALDVRDFLNSAGILCTIEIGRPNLGTRSGDYLIVGTRGFAPRYGNTAAYKTYTDTIDQVSLSFPDKSKFRQPQKMMVKWTDE